MVTNNPEQPYNVFERFPKQFEPFEGEQTLPIQDDDMLVIFMKDGGGGQMVIP